MYVIVKQVAGRDDFKVTDWEGDMLFSVRAYTSGITGYTWSNWGLELLDGEVPGSGWGRDLEDAVRAGLHRSIGYSAEDAEREAREAVANFHATDWEITEGTSGDDFWPVTLRRCVGGAWAVVDHFMTREDAQFYIDPLTQKVLA